MKYAKKLVCIIVCSFLLGCFIPINKKEQRSMNGCNDEVYAQMTNFYLEEKNSLDVLILGDSNVYRGFNPMVLWQHERVASFVLASPSQPAWLSYFVLQDALENQKPSIVVFEINELFAKAKGQTSRYCKAINAIKSDDAHLHAIQNKDSGFDDEDRSVLYKTYVKQTFHQSISSFRNTKRETSTLNNKGYLLNTSVIPMLSGNSYMSRYDVHLEIDDNAVKQIDRIIQLCKENDITLLFTKLPTKEWTTQKSDMANAYARARGIPLLDMNNDVNGINWSNDTKDNGFHMNDFGAEKVTQTLTRFMKENVVLKPTQDRNVIHNYNHAYKRYMEVRKHSLASNNKNDIK